MYLDSKVTIDCSVAEARILHEALDIAHAVASLRNMDAKADEFADLKSDFACELGIEEDEDDE